MPTRANGQPALGTHPRDGAGVRNGNSLIVLTLSGERISAMTRFEGSVLGRSDYRDRSRPDDDGV